MASHRTRSDSRPGLSHHLNPAESLPHVRGHRPPRARRTELRSVPAARRRPQALPKRPLLLASPIGPARRLLRRTPHRATDRGPPLWGPESAFLGAGHLGVEGGEPVERREIVHAQCHCASRRSNSPSRTRTPRCTAPTPTTSWSAPDACTWSATRHAERATDRPRYRDREGGLADDDRVRDAPSGAAVTAAS